jgi:SAM-dependent methyltransferase
MIFNNLAAIYDIIYKKKDYSKEVEFLDIMLKETNSETVLDVGCGIGTRALLLSQKGYNVVGIDRSSEMIRLAKSRASLDFRNIDILDFKGYEKFDCCIILFNVLGYIDNIPKFFSVIKKHLKKRGLIVLDFWDSDLLRKKGIKKFKINFYFSNKRLFVRLVRSKMKNSEVWVDYDVFEFPKFKVFRETHLIKSFKESDILREASKQNLRREAGFLFTDITKTLAFKS